MHQKLTMKTGLKIRLLIDLVARLDDLNKYLRAENQFNQYNISNHNTFQIKLNYDKLR